ncbi:unnamed protein product [Caenorhabditis auriculariae]|uniref:Ground-like domain-containing protein n=1 Tax=Caenorhabditis auriculariae TaxID=2777116 RepID=A0A8S1GTL2_9PELO|nr:unnamed protein product [Caenorhabditis auriculariae]
MLLRSAYLLLVCLTAGVWTQRLRQGRRRSKFVRLPSGFVFPADAAANFQRDAYVAPTAEQAAASSSGSVLVAPPRMNPSPEGEYPTVSGGNEKVLVSSMSLTESEVVPAENPAQSQSYVESATIEVATAGPAVTVSYATTAESSTLSYTATTHRIKANNTVSFVNELNRRNHGTEAENIAKGHTYTALSGGQFYQSIFGGKNGFSPLSFFLNQGGGGHNPNNFFVPVPIVVPPPPPPPPGPKCYTNPSGYLCCNVTLEKTMEEAFNEAKADGISLCNVQKMASAVQEAAEKKFNTSFESVAAHKDFVAKINFAGDLNCKIEVDGKFILAYATPIEEKEVNIIDANSFFSGTADEQLDSANGTKPTYIVYGPIR